MNIEDEELRNPFGNAPASNTFTLKYGLWEVLKRHPEGLSVGNLVQILESENWRPGISQKKNPTGILSGELVRDHRFVKHPEEVGKWLLLPLARLLPCWSDEELHEREGGQGGSLQPMDKRKAPHEISPQDEASAGSKKLRKKGDASPAGDMPMLPRRSNPPREWWKGAGSEHAAAQEAEQGMSTGQRSKGDVEKELALRNQSSKLGPISVEGRNSETGQAAQGAAEATIEASRTADAGKSPEESAFGSIQPVPPKFLIPKRKDHGGGPSQLGSPFGPSPSKGRSGTIASPTKSASRPPTSMSSPLGSKDQKHLVRVVSDATTNAAAVTEAKAVDEPWEVLMRRCRSVLAE
jgi:hypothetical protein